MLSCDCETFVKLRWDDLERPLTSWEKLVARYHRFLCRPCAKHSKEVDSVAHQLEEDAEAPPLSRKYKMTAEAKEKLKDSVKNRER